MSNETSLVFCRENVDPDLVTRLLDLSPTQSFRVGDQYEWQAGTRISSVGLWKMRLTATAECDTVEQQLAAWLELLQPRAKALERLVVLDYHPYVDCKAEPRSLSLCIDPDLLSGLGALKVALSVWLYENGARA